PGGSHGLEGTRPEEPPRRQGPLGSELAAGDPRSSPRPAVAAEHPAPQGDTAQHRPDLAHAARKHLVPSERSRTQPARRHRPAPHGSTYQPPHHHRVDPQAPTGPRAWAYGPTCRRSTRPDAVCGQSAPRPTPPVSDCPTFCPTSRRPWHGTRFVGHQTRIATHELRLGQRSRTPATDI